MHLISSARNVTWAERWLWAQAYVLLGIMRLAIKMVTFQRLVTWFGKRQTESSYELPTEQLAVAQQVKWAIASASRFTPWKSNCFPQAAAAQQLLRQRGIRSTLYLGAKFDTQTLEQPRELKAHAWLRSGSYIVTGELGHKQFGVVATFAS
ncbi:MAG: lasso peptide biosynthesis B2 protein [Candidatus Promineifilaceae bacterium]